jgi:hypothetical protein
VRIDVQLRGDLDARRRDTVFQAGKKADSKA